MDTIVTSYQTERASRAASEVLEHQLDSIWDAVRSASEAHAGQDADKTLEWLQRVDRLALSANSTCRTLKELQERVREDEAKVAINEAPFADQVTVNEEAAAPVTLEPATPFVPGLRPSVPDADSPSPF